MTVEVPVGDRRARRHEATKAEILEVAWTLAREGGLAALSLAEIAARMGMRAPSLYSYFASKAAIYDAMFAQGYEEFLARGRRLEVTGDAVRDTRAGLRLFCEFCVQDPARYQLMFQRTIPGFEPSAASFALAVEALELVRRQLGAAGITEGRHLDLITALATGLVDQQISNDPAGDRWLRLIDEAVDMYLAHAKPTPPKRRAKR